MTEAELVFTRILNKDRLSLYLDRLQPLAPEAGRRIAQILLRRISGEPVQYIFKEASFMGLDFEVTPDVLIPRQETELLVETSARIMDSLPSACRVLDLGCGCGCIGIALKRAHPLAQVVCLDVSHAAIAVARRNAAQHTADISFIESDLLAGEQCAGRTFDLIATNPPYVPSEVIPGLQHEVRKEPRVALDGGDDGLRMYHRIAREAPRYLAAGGYLVTEIGAGQRSCVEEILHKFGGFEIIEVIRDYRGLDRVIVAKTTHSHG